MTIQKYRRRKAGTRSTGLAPLRPLPGTLSAHDLRLLVAEMVD
jgi:hypothetical protein